MLQKFKQIIKKIIGYYFWIQKRIKRISGSNILDKIIKESKKSVFLRSQKRKKKV
jgi:hypothetical protein